VVPRLNFLPPEQQAYADRDTPLLIGFGQTISAPHMVAIMNEALKLEVGNKVLEIGSGSGWLAAIMAELVTSVDEPRSEWGHIYSIEIIPELVEMAKKNVRNAGYNDRVTVINADGSKGYPQKAPYDRIVVNAAAPDLPQPLLDQLKNGGKMIIPLGKASLFQSLMLVTKEADGTIKREHLGGVSFVPLTGEFGQKA
jgi:protein-L-isoaspartate(D-aspartate) O-methyltransferase